MDENDSGGRLPGLTDALRHEAYRIEEDCLYSSKSHFNAASTWRRRHYGIGIPATVLGAAAGAAFVKEWPLLAQLFAIAAPILTGLLTFLKPSDKASEHKQVADQYLTLKNQTRVFREVELLQNETNAVQRLQELGNKRNELNQTSPDIPRSAFSAARRGIAEGESSHAVDGNA